MKGALNDSHDRSNNTVFDNSIALKSSSSVTPLTVSIQDLSQPGRSIRRDGDGGTLMIASQETKENPGYKTRRTVVRLELPVTGGTNPIVPNAKIIVQLTFSVPKDSAWPVSVVSPAYSALVNFIHSGGNSGALVEDGANATLTANLDRILDGEI